MVKKLLHTLCAALLLCTGVVIPKNTFAGNSTYATEQPWFKVWKTIKLGTGQKTTDDFRTALHGGGHEISVWVIVTMNSPAFTVSGTEKIVDLALFTVAELGFKDGARLANIYARAQELGLELAPAEVGPQLRLQYVDQPNREYLVIGMEPIAFSDGSLNVFHLSGRHLDSYGGYPNDFWYHYGHFVFVLPSTK
ncbi:MAG: hypothetical protein HYT36_02200 [Candidatus Staskawiczbacteria bacterium]|nr:hypothetical protein [Candidatus Staskawiczbacteria bacterium]